MSTGVCIHVDVCHVNIVCHEYIDTCAQVRPIDKLDEACTNADDRMMLVQHCNGDCVMS